MELLMQNRYNDFVSPRANSAYSKYISRKLIYKGRFGMGEPLSKHTHTHTHMQSRSNTGNFLLDMKELKL